MNVPEILARLAASALEGEVIFPTTADMALKIQRLLDDPDCSVDQLARLVQADPLLATRMVAVANSVIYNRSGQNVASVKNALTRLGFKIVRVLTAAVVVRQMEDVYKRQAIRSDGRLSSRRATPQASVSGRHRTQWHPIDL